MLADQIVRRCRGHSTGRCLREAPGKPSGVTALKTYGGLRTDVGLFVSDLGRKGELQMRSTERGRPWRGLYVSQSPRIQRPRPRMSLRGAPERTYIVSQRCCLLVAVLIAGGCTAYLERSRSQIRGEALIRTIKATLHNTGPRMSRGVAEQE